MVKDAGGKMNMLRVLLALSLLLPATAMADAPTPGGLKQTFSDPGPAAAPAAPAPAAPAPSSATKETPRSDAPMGDYTKYYAKKDFVAGGADMTYYWRQPKMAPDTTYPLVVVLHDEKGLATAAQYVLQTESSNPSFIVVPMISTKRIWAFPSEYPDDPSLQKYLKVPQALPDVADLVSEIRKNYPVDDKRIYIVGCGEGGFGVMGALYNYPSTFAAAIAINGGWTQKQTFKIAKANVPLYVIQGADDKIASPAIASYVAYDIQKFKGPVSWLSVPGAGHDCTDPNFYMTPLWKWMFQQHRK